MTDFVAAWRVATRPPVADGAVDRATIDPSGDLVNPYKGLRAFDEADARDFHGRDRAVEQLLDLLDAHRFVAIVGPSGSGKSSLVRAGLAPRLRAMQRVVAVAIPGATPVDEIADALVQVAVHPAAALRERLVEPAELGAALADLLPADGTEVVLVLDQFEELWTLTDPVLRDRLLDALATAAQSPAGRLRIVVTVRADFFDRPLGAPGDRAARRARRVPAGAARCHGAGAGHRRAGRQDRRVDRAGAGGRVDRCAGRAAGRPAAAAVRPDRAVRAARRNDDDRWRRTPRWADWPAR